MNQTWKSNKTSNFGPDFGRFGPILGSHFLWVLPLLVIRHCSKLSSYVIQKKTDAPNLRKWQKKLNLRPNFGLLDPNLGPKIGLTSSSSNILIGLTSSSSNIVASYNCMQFQGQLMNQTWENGNKPSFKTNFGPFGPFGPNLGPKNIFHQFYLYYMLEIAASYHCMQFQGKPMNQTWENGRKSSVRLKFGPLRPKFSPKTFFVGFSSTRCYALL